ncbi:phage tail protein [Variovorax boronicumulans]|uniref:Phage tail protein n=1 Tax=Variovorax boronicumulans TaxID=436515 RepID=A0A250DS69_9BURK|nr:tail protein X [Variovorax boronicumulans]ATA57207.1 phage tail protein [Variovorax boronicumulans]
MPRTVIAQQHDTVDLLCLRHLGATAAVTEAVYRLNPGLADIGPILPLGREVILPDLPANTARVETVQLWD